MIWLIGLVIWVFAGYAYLSAGGYERHGAFSLLVILPYMLCCAVWALLMNLIFGRPE